MKTLLFVSTLLFLGCDQQPARITDTVQEQNPPIAKSVDIEDWEKRMKANPGTVLDVRTPEEIAQGMIPEAAHIDFLGEGFTDKLESLDKTQPVYVYCRSGGRSERAMEVMSAEGFVEVYDLQGGFTAWAASDRPTESP